MAYDPVGKGLPMANSLLGSVLEGIKFARGEQQAEDEHRRLQQVMQLQAAEEGRSAELFPMQKQALQGQNDLQGQAMERGALRLRPHTPEQEKLIGPAIAGAGTYDEALDLIGADKRSAGGNGPTSAEVQLLKLLMGAGEAQTKQLEAELAQMDGTLKALSLQASKASGARRADLVDQIAVLRSKRNRKATELQTAKQHQGITKSQGVQKVAGKVGANIPQGTLMPEEEEDPYSWLRMTDEDLK